MQQGWEKANEYKEQFDDTKGNLEDAADKVGVTVDWDVANQLKDKAQGGMNTVRDLGDGIANQNLGTDPVDALKKAVSMLPFHPSVVAIFIILLGIAIYTLLLVTTAVEVKDFKIITTLIYAALSFMDLLRERLVYLTDNNLVYGEVMGRQFLTQPRELSLFWVWIPGSYFTGDTDTFIRVVLEMWLVCGILAFTQLDNQSFKEHNNTGLEPEVLGSLCLLLGCFTVLPVVYLCWRGQPMTEENKVKKEVKPGFEKFAFFFEILGVLKKTADAAKDGDHGGLWEAAKTARRASQVYSDAIAQGKTPEEAKAMASNTVQEAEIYNMKKEQLGGGNFGYPDDQSYSVVGDVAFQSAPTPQSAGVFNNAEQQRHQPVMAHGHHFGQSVGNLLHTMEDRMEKEGGEHEYFDEDWEDRQYERVNANTTNGFEVQLGSPDKDFKALFMPILGSLAALGSALFYEGIKAEWFTWTKEDGEVIDLADRADKAGKLLMVFAWTCLSQLASQGFKDTDMEIKAKRKMTELEERRNKAGEMTEAEHAIIERELKLVTEAEPVGILEGLKNAFFNPGWLCTKETFIEEDAVKVNGKWQPTGKQNRVEKWLGMLWLTAVVANLAKYGVAARGAVFAWLDEDDKQTVSIYVWLEMGFITALIATFFGISFRVIARNPNLRSNYVPGAVDPKPKADPPPPAEPRTLALPMAPPMPLWTQGPGGGLGALPGYINGGFRPRQPGEAPPPLFLAPPGFNPGASVDPRAFRPLPGYRGFQ